jgi:antibiotic biosynthesis monooxygenase (ABM) superfamily enzyme
VLLVYPVSIGLSLFLAAKLGRIPLPLRVLLVTALITSVMMVVVAPLRRHIRRRRTL